MLKRKDVKVGPRDRLQLLEQRAGFYLEPGQPALAAADIESEKPGKHWHFWRFLTLGQAKADLKKTK